MTSHADLPTLLAYWLGELDPEREARVEEHYLGCEACSASLAEVEALADGMRRAFRGGHVGVAMTPGFVERLRARGLRIREYVVPANGSVNCSVGPGDQVLLSRLRAPLGGVGRVDVILEGGQRLEDVPFDAAAGEVVLAPAIEMVRALPAHRQVMRLVAVEGGEDRILGDYTFNHSPHA